MVISIILTMKRVRTFTVVTFCGQSNEIKSTFEIQQSVELLAGKLIKVYLL